MADELVEAVDAVQEFVRRDGGSLALTGFDLASGTLFLRLDLRDAECAECVMPRGFLEQLLLDKIKGVAPQVDHLVIDDPRVT